MSNLKQINLGMLQYTQDYDEKLPVHNASVSSDGFHGWAVLLGPYLKSTQIFQCPSDSTIAPTTPDKGGYTDYALNLTLGYDGSAARGLSLAALTQPTLTVSFCEDLDANPTATNPVSRSYFWSAGNAATTNGTVPADGFATFRGAAQRHLDGANFAFTDGHVKWYKASSTTKSAAVYNWHTPATVSGNSPTFNPSPS